MSLKKKKTLKVTQEDEIERKLDALWENWESRRRCEATHTPNFIKMNNKKKKLQ